MSNIARYADRRLAPVALLAELDRIIDGDRFPLLPRIQILTRIRNKFSNRRRCASRCRRRRSMRHPEWVANADLKSQCACRGKPGGICKVIEGRFELCHPCVA